MDFIYTNIMNKNTSIKNIYKVRLNKTSKDEGLGKQTKTFGSSIQNGKVTKGKFYPGNRVIGVVKTF